MILFNDNFLPDNTFQNTELKKFFVFSFVIICNGIYLNPSKMAKPISDFISEKMEIPTDKIYISFEDVPASMWAWNGRTFG